VPAGLCPPEFTKKLSRTVPISPSRSASYATGPRTEEARSHTTKDRFPLSFSLPETVSGRGGVSPESAGPILPEGLEKRCPGDLTTLGLDRRCEMQIDKNQKCGGPSPCITSAVSPSGTQRKFRLRRPCLSPRIRRESLRNTLTYGAV